MSRLMLPEGSSGRPPAATRADCSRASARASEPREAEPYRRVRARRTRSNTCPTPSPAPGARAMLLPSLRMPVGLSGASAWPMVGSPRSFVKAAERAKGLALLAASEAGKTPSASRWEYTVTGASPAAAGPPAPRVVSSVPVAPSGAKDAPSAAGSAMVARGGIQPQLTAKSTSRAEAGRGLPSWVFMMRAPEASA